MKSIGRMENYLAQKKNAKALEMGRGYKLRKLHNDIQVLCRSEK